MTKHWGEEEEEEEEYLGEVQGNLKIIINSVQHGTLHTDNQIRLSFAEQTHVTTGTTVPHLFDNESG